jgi:hypothetical protein
MSDPNDRQNHRQNDRDVDGRIFLLAGLVVLALTMAGMVFVSSNDEQITAQTMGLSTPRSQPLGPPEHMAPAPSPVTPSR